ncbi:hypothetical protein CPU12_01995 [Malaciobacter molluscorum LMG 25693]|uniref:Rhodanese domain-containing protein n=1 Tax=Malaciobacter molluscorum LMG 25693 TaxID=870501 RepID=A0A2G1DKN2_9BACT|nr:hypothetical protein [Malaciobacter molluscorum]AXX92617.1 hypothetical protein AMOL_1652 [Malaciobacter molluscorum LMG 25693]PHO19041.1 hypothetical protein CPU12_01995 [Malaciobacter molluscorum LMG 25693]RXJ97347.1 hypothetical protein CRV00_00480 [Malaciobacter molluscorum]
MFEEDIWTQEELLKNKKELEKKNIKVVLVDTILKPLDNMETVTYNPFELKNFPKGSVFVFYCDTGKTTQERLSFYKSKFPEYKCVSLKGGRAYWRPYFQLLEGNNND